MSNCCRQIGARGGCVALAGDFVTMDLTLDNSLGKFSAAPKPPAGTPTLLRGVLVPNGASEPGKYARNDVLIHDGVLKRVAPGGTLSLDADCPPGTVEEDCAERMLVPGFVNGHTHSVEHWARGLIKPLPLEMWVLQLIRHEPRGDEGWAGPESWIKTPAAAIAVSAMHCGVEALLSGTTAIMDHLLCRDIKDVEAAAFAYKALGIRAYIAPMLGDDLEPYVNYVPLARDAKGRNEAICGPAGHAPGCADCGGLCTNGAFRTEKGERDPAKTEANLALWREAAEKFHDPVNGINIVVGPVTAYSASTELLRGAAEIRKEFGLCGHIHLLETRAQALMARQFLPSGSAVKHLRDAGFLQVPGTTCGHCVWLDDEEVAIMAECEATAVHNPFSNLRLGSGVAPLFSYAQRGMNVCLGADGACSSDGQDMLEVAKLANILPCVATPEYRDWPTAHYTAMRLGAANGYKGILLEGKPGQLGKGGVLEEGALADVSLWDLTSLSMLPRTDPLSLLIQGSRTQAPGAGSALDSAWVNGTRVVKNGSPVNVDVIALREVLRHAQGEYRDPAITDPSTHDKTARAEKEYRAAMDLDPAGAVGDRPHYEWPEHCTLYEASQR